MVKVIISYVCEVCRNSYGSEDDAKSCEEKGTTQPLKDGEMIRFKHKGKTEESKVLTYVVERETHSLKYLVDVGGNNIIEVYESEIIVK